VCIGRGMEDNDVLIAMQEEEGQEEGGRGDGFKSVLARAEYGMGGLDVGVEEAGIGVGGRGASSVVAEENLASSITRQKVAAVKQIIENHYKSHMKSLQERKER
jgi:serine/threonine kinase 38